MGANWVSLVRHLVSVPHGLWQLYAAYRADVCHEMVLLVIESEKEHGARNSEQCDSKKYLSEGGPTIVLCGNEWRATIHAVAILVCPPTALLECTLLASFVYYCIYW